MPDSKPHPPDWALLFFWIMATSVGWVAGALIFSGIPLASSGVGIAALQWAVLNNRIERAWRWAGLSSIAWIAGVILLVTLIPERLYLWAGPLLGGLLGFSQWFLLKREVDWSGWWIPISILAWTTGLTLLPGFITSGSLPGALTGLALIILFSYGSKRPFKS